MDKSEGFQIEVPGVFVRWGMRESELLSALAPTSIRHVTDGYYTIECISLGGLRHMLGFHFQPRVNGVLTELEFFRNRTKCLQASFEEFQRHLEGSFGPPTEITPGSRGFPTYRWRMDDIELTHSVFDHFGLTEWVRLKRM